jgi:hypothetical protein
LNIKQFIYVAFSQNAYLVMMGPLYSILLCGGYGRVKMRGVLRDLYSF